MMEGSKLIILGLLLVNTLLVGQSQPVTSFLEPEEGIPLPSGVEVFFAPSDNLEDRVVELIESAETEIVFNAYAITSHKILSALMDAYVTRKIFVAGLMDPEPSVRRYNTPEFFQLNGLPFAYPRVGNSFNNHSYIVVDRRVALTGSYQFTQTRAANHENIIIIYEPGVAVEYYNHFVGILETAVMPRPLPTESNE